MQSYKFDDFVQINEKRIRDIEDEVQVDDETSSSQEETQKSNGEAKTKFSIRSFVGPSYPDGIKKICNFDLEELRYLSDVLDNELGKTHRGKRSSFSTIDHLFISFTYYATNSTLDILAKSMKIKRPNLAKKIQKVSTTYLPVFARRFVHREFIACSTRFVNFPDAECAVGSITIPFFTTKEEIKHKKAANMKNKVNGQKLQAAVNPRGIAIHINTDHPGSIHDKKTLRCKWFVGISYGHPRKSDNYPSGAC